MLPVMKRYGAEKILFGTDYPMWSPVTEIENFMSLPFDDEERALILYKNAKKVFQIG